MYVEEKGKDKGKGKGKGKDKRKRKALKIGSILSMFNIFNCMEL